MTPSASQKEIAGLNEYRCGAVPIHLNYPKGTKPWIRNIDRSE